MSENSRETRTIFQDIWAGDAPARLLYRSDRHRLMAILSPKPVTTGHTLIVPEQPISRWQDMPPELAAKAILLGQVVARRMMRILSPALVTVHIMGYSEKHTHMKIIPSYEEYDTAPVYRTCPQPRPTFSSEALDATRYQLAFPDELAQRVDDTLALQLPPDALSGLE